MLGVLDYFTTGCNDFLLIFIHDFEEDKTQVTGMHVIAMGQTLSVFNYTQSGGGSIHFSKHNGVPKETKEDTPRVCV